RRIRPDARAVRLFAVARFGEASWGICAGADLRLLPCGTTRSAREKPTRTPAAACALLDLDRLSVVGQRRSGSALAGAEDGAGGLASLGRSVDRQRAGDARHAPRQLSGSLPAGNCRRNAAAC